MASVLRLKINFNENKQVVKSSEWNERIRKGQKNFNTLIE